MTETSQTIAVKLTPGARRNEVIGWEDDLFGHKTLKVCVTAIPERGKANTALIELLSDYWNVPKSSIEIARGHTSRLKLVKIMQRPVAK